MVEINYNMDRKRLSDDLGKPIPKHHFMARESLLTRLYHDSTNTQTLFQWAQAVVYVTLLAIVARDYLDPAERKADLDMWFWVFRGFDSVVRASLTMMMSIVICFHPCLRLYLKLRAQMAPESPQAVWLRRAFLIAYAGYLVALFAYCINVIRVYQLSPPMSCTLTLKKLSLIMKVHSYLYESLKEEAGETESAPSGERQGHVAGHVDGQVELHHSKGLLGNTSQVVLFVMAPTLVYRATYPRTDRTNWSKFFWYLAQFWLLAAYEVLTLRSFPARYGLDQIGKNPLEWRHLPMLTAEVFFMGIQHTILFFYAYLHCWLNMRAELTRFADRQFYLDWWNAGEGTQHITRWNKFVSEWCFLYGYKPVKESTKSHLKATLAVFVLSLAIHEYFVFMIGRFLLPIFTFVYIGISVDAMIASSGKAINESVGGRMANFVKVCGAFGVIYVLLIFEYYSRKNCQMPHDSVMQYFKLQMGKCVTWK